MMSILSSTKIIQHWNDVTYHKLCAICKTYSWGCEDYEFAYNVYLESICYVASLLYVKYFDRFRYPNKDDYAKILKYWVETHDYVVPIMERKGYGHDDYEFAMNAYIEGAAYAIDEIFNFYSELENKK